ncbi:ABC transporter ATP-binding protein [Pyxidicoccus fallax]|uniref:ABC transporter ATP-binding protein n=1 Tax=Pyxidicoccus fallax TaxID=394095 RepID=A0A848LYF8_9BACT|nr:ABC transporter ATP-binding protein [Pyxidicoccus fallax]NMO22661.1 ABC transporter ATP-binding protein [Pyxidicoccus fallax]NPC84699.1 ABC transporter ATP-binding protein [Pyxidicoccus fallax]
MTAATKLTAPEAPVTSEGPAPVRIRGLSKTYRVGFFLNKQVKALQGLDLDIAPGQVYGLLGPNGAGKSTTIKILMGLVRASQGEALLFGESPDRPHVRRQVGFLPENPSLYEYLTGREFVTLAGRIFGLSGQELDQRVTRVLGEVGMGRASDLQIRRYSKGMVQRTALAQALISQPRLLVLDEPTSGLDPLGRRQMRDIILAEREKGTTILFCTHIISDVEALCDRVAVLVGGKRVQEGSVQELVSARTPSVELVVHGLPLEQLQALGFTYEHAQQLDSRVRLRVPDADAHRLLQAVIAQGGRVSSLQPARFSLEDLFLEAMQKAGGQTVGGEIQ